MKIFEIRNKKNLAVLFLRIGIAFAFFYASISIFLNPSAWIGFVPKFVEILIPSQIFLYGHASLDMILGLWLLTGKKIFYASILTALNLFLIIILNLGALDVVFRDVSIFFSAIALAVLTKKDK